ncbi:MAG: carbohydrate ABC transporter permease [Ahrensia sp.]
MSTAQKMPRPVRSTIKAGSLLVFFAFVFLPLVQVVLLSFMSTLPRNDIARGSITLLNYATIWNDPDLRASLFNSVTYVTLNIFVTLAVAIPAAYAFSRYRFAGARQLFLVFLAFRITPPVVLMFPVFQLFASMNLINAPLGIALAHCMFNLPVSIWILQSFMNAIPVELDETARLDGHKLPSFFMRIFLPLLAPGIGVAAFFCFMFSWVEVVFARILTVTGGKPISMAINALFGFQTDIGLVMAMTMMSIVPGVIMVYFARHHIAKGFTINKSA